MIVWIDRKLGYHSALQITAVNDYKKAKKFEEMAAEQAKKDVKVCCLVLELVCASNFVGAERFARRSISVQFQHHPLCSRCFVMV